MVTKNRKILSMLLSLIIATIIWMAMSNNINPLIHERVSVPIDIRVDSELSDAGRSFSLPTENQKVLVDYYVRKDDVGKVSLNDISAYVNIMEDESGFVGINFVFNDKRKLMHNVTYDKEKVYVTVDDMAHKSIKVSYIIKGRLANDNLAVAYVSVEPNELFVNGPATEVDKVDKIAFDIDVTGKYQNFTGSARPSMYDAEGNILTKDLTMSGNLVNYIVSVNSTKTVSFNTHTTGNVAPWHSFAGITVNPSNITIAASNDVLATIQAIDIPNIDITDLSENKEYEFNLLEVLPRGIRNVSSVKTVKVTVMVNSIRNGNDFGNNFDRERDKAPIDFNRPIDEPKVGVIVSPTSKATTESSEESIDTENVENTTVAEESIEEETSKEE